MVNAETMGVAKGILLLSKGIDISHYFLHRSMPTMPYGDNLLYLSFTHTDRFGFYISSYFATSCIARQEPEKIRVTFSKNCRLIVISCPFQKNRPWKKVGDPGGPTGKDNTCSE